MEELTHKSQPKQEPAYCVFKNLLWGNTSANSSIVSITFLSGGSVSLVRGLEPPGWTQPTDCFCQYDFNGHSHSFIWVWFMATFTLKWQTWVHVVAKAKEIFLRLFREKVSWPLLYFMTSRNCTQPQRAIFLSYHLWGDREPPVRAISPSKVHMRSLKYPL